MKSCPVGIDLFEENVRADYFDRQNWFYPLKYADGKWETFPSLYIDNAGRCFIGREAKNMLSSSYDMLWSNFLRYISVRGGWEHNGEIFTVKDVDCLFFEKYIGDLERQNNIRAISLILVPPYYFGNEEKRILQRLLRSMYTIPVILRNEPLPTSPPYPACSQCGHEMASGDLFCRGCGTRYTGEIRQDSPFSPWENAPVIVYGPPPMLWRMVCPKCHTSWEEDSMFQPKRYCPQCGTLTDVVLADD